MGAARKTLTLATAAALLALLAPAPAATQAEGPHGLQLEASGVWTTLVGGAFPHGETGIGAAAGLRHVWSSGVSLGLKGFHVQPEDLSLPNDDRRRTMRSNGVVGSFRYQLATGGVARPFVGLRAGWKSLSSENVDGADGSGFLGGLEAGTELWLGDRVGFHVTAVPAGFSLSDFAADDDNTTGVSWSVEAGFSVFLGDASPDSDGDGVDDEDDRCEGTPAGITVDAEGCPADTDADGVPDHEDACPQTLRGAEVDEEGCARDTDADGVADGLDACPDTPEGARVDDEGCGLDADGDGVPDGVDACADTPEGAEVDAEGCVPDTDADGVGDPDDRCPGTVEGAAVDQEGCSQVQRGLDEGRLSMTGLAFEVDQVALGESLRQRMDQVGRQLVRNPDMTIEIRVHTDALGPADQNRAQTQRLADAVKDYLLREYPEIQSTRIGALGFGESEPVASNETAEGRAQNRRVEVVVLESGPGQGGQDGG